MVKNPSAQWNLTESKVVQDFFICIITTRLGVSLLVWSQCCPHSGLSEKCGPWGCRQAQVVSMRRSQFTIQSVILLVRHAI